MKLNIKVHDDDSVSIKMTIEGTSEKFTFGNQVLKDQALMTLLTFIDLVSIDNVVCYKGGIDFEALAGMVKND